MIKKVFVVVFFLFPSYFFAQTTDDLLVTIGMLKTEDVFLNFQMQNGFNAKLELPSKGVKLYTDQANQYVKSIVFTNAGYNINNRSYEKYNGLLPLNISLDDSFPQICKTLGNPIDTFESVYEFNKFDYVIKVETTPKKDKINCVTYTKNITKAGNVLDRVVEAKETVSLADNGSSFRKAILTVFDAAKDPTWSKIIVGKSPQKNFWKYAFTWKTGISIPNEMYNLVYAFPYVNSQRDFVSVIAEDKNGNTNALAQKYNNFKQKFMAEFPQSEGWVYNFEPNVEDKSAPQDMKAFHPSVGTVVLDYSKSPWGASVVYLRFLFQYN